MHPQQAPLLGAPVWTFAGGPCVWGGLAAFRSGPQWHPQLESVTSCLPFVESELDELDPGLPGLSSIQLPLSCSGPGMAGPCWWPTGPCSVWTMWNLTASQPVLQPSPASAGMPTPPSLGLTLQLEAGAGGRWA